MSRQMTAEESRKRNFEVTLDAMVKALDDRVSGYLIEDDGWQDLKEEAAFSLALLEGNDPIGKALEGNAGDDMPWDEEEVARLEQRVERKAILRVIANLLHDIEGKN